MTHMHRRRLLEAAAAVPLGTLVGHAGATAMQVRPGDPGWPDAERWAALGRQVGGRLSVVRSPLAECRDAPSGPACRQLMKDLKNPWFIGDNPGLAQTLGWTDAWTFEPSAYAVTARDAADVAAAVDFARTHRVRLVVKGGGHSYQGTSNAADSLLLWTRAMDAIELIDGFVPEGCADAPQPAVRVGAGVVWGPLYDKAATEAGRYVQGGGCLTVGVAGLVLSGGFGSFSKGYGLAAASLLQAEVVTADGRVRTVNRCRDPELFWGLKGGGGGSLGIVTRVVLRTHPLPERFGIVNMTISASSDAAYRRLVGMTMAHVRDRLLDPHWGEQIHFRRGRVVNVAMLFQGLDRAQAVDTWQAYIDAVTASPSDFRMTSPPLIVTLDARRFWNADYLRRFPGAAVHDDQDGASPGRIFWSGDQGQTGQVLHAYQSTWLPAALLEDDRRDALCDALVAGSARWQVGLHLNKGLAGATPDVVAAARDTAMNPAVLDAFALAIVAANEQPAYPGLAGHEPNVAEGRLHRAAVDGAMRELRRIVPGHGSYLSESDYFEADWERAFWGDNRARLQAAKARYDPEGLFDVHHGIGSSA